MMRRFAQNPSRWLPPRGERDVPGIDRHFFDRGLTDAAEGFWTPPPRTVPDRYARAYLEGWRAGEQHRRAALAWAFDEEDMASLRRTAVNPSKRCSWCGGKIPASWPPGAMHVACAARAVESEARAAKGRPAVVPMPSSVHVARRLASDPSHAQDLVARMRQAEHGSRRRRRG